MTLDIRQKLSELEKQILDAYLQHTVVERVCKTSSVDPTDRINQFRQIAGNVLIERERITTPNNYLLLDEIGASVARDEIRYLVQNLAENCPKSESTEITYATINDSARTIETQGFLPNHIFLPIDYYHEVLKWNQIRKRNDWTGGSIFNSFYTEDGIFLRVTFSNRYIPFNSAILTSLESNLWEYRPTENSGRLTVKFDWDYNDSTNTLLSVKTVFNHVIAHPQGNLVLPVAPRS